MRVLLADDHWFMPDMLRNILNAENPESEVIGAATLGEALSIAGVDKNFDLILLDLNMPGMKSEGSGKYMGLSQMKSVCPNIPVAIFSGEEREEIIEEVLSKGAAGYIPKSLPRNSLIAAINLLVSGMSFAPRPAFQRLSKKHDGQQESATQQAAEKGTNLSAREKEVYRLIVQGLSNKAIAEELGIAEVTVKEYVSAILRKHRVKNRKQIIAAAVRQ